MKMIRIATPEQIAIGMEREEQIINEHHRGFYLSKSKFEADYHAYGILNHTHNIVELLRSSMAYRDLPKR